MRPEFEAALKKSISFSSKFFIVDKPFIAEKGKAAFLMKGSATKKRKRAEMEGVKEFE